MGWLTVELNRCAAIHGLRKQDTASVVDRFPAAAW
jgi:hypothetical protein